MARTESGAGGDLRLTVGLFLATIAAMASFSSVLRGSAWWQLSVLVAAIVFAATHLLRKLGIPTLWAWLGVLAAWFFSLMWLFASSSALFGIIPTLTTVSEFASLTSEATRGFIENEAPLTVETPDLFVMAAIAGLLAIAVDALTFGRRVPALTGILFADVFLAPTVIAGMSPSVLVFVAIAVPWLYVLRADIRRRMKASGDASERTRRQFTLPSVAIAAAAVAVGVVVPPALPATTGLGISWGNPPPGAFDSGINPILALGQNLRRGSTVKVLEYSTDATRPLYLKVTNLHDFTGKTWRPGTTNVSSRSADVLEGRGALGSAIPNTDISTRINIFGLNAKLLPSPYPAQAVDGLKGAWRWQPEGRNSITSTSGTRGQKYTVSSLQISPTLEQMRDADARASGALYEYTKVPARMPRSIRETANAVTAGMDNDYDRALALQTYFRSGDFTYSETAPVEDGFDGNGVDVIAEFLNEKSGYCVHFSSAMAVMARTLGIPARIAVGYAPGDLSGKQINGKPIYEVTSDLLHSWPELYFDGVGWVSFEPTPGRGSATTFRSAFTDPRDAQSPQTEVDPGTQNDLPGDTAVVDGSAAAAESSTVRSPVFLALFAGLALLGIPGLIRTFRRRRRLVRALNSQAPASAVWGELRDSARDYGVPVSRADTPRSFARRLAQGGGVDATALDRLLVRVERERYARPGAQPTEGADCVTDLHAIRHSFNRGATRRERLQATMWPRSLFGQMTYAAAPADLIEGTDVRFV